MTLMDRSDGHAGRPTRAPSSGSRGIVASAGEGRRLGRSPYGMRRIALGRAIRWACEPRADPVGTRCGPAPTPKDTGAASRAEGRQGDEAGYTRPSA